MVKVELQLHMLKIRLAWYQANDPLNPIIATLQTLIANLEACRRC